MINSQITIVVANDKQEVIDAVAKDITMLAQKHGKNIRILKAISGSEVIKLAEDEHIDAFFIDYMFDYGMNGDEIIQHIADPFEAKFFILMSGWKEDVLEKIITTNHRQLKSRCRFLRKPFDALTFQASFLDMFSFFDARPYPLPIQYVYDVVQNSEGMTRALALKDFYETLLKFSVSILMADLLRQDNSTTFRVGFKSDAKLTYGIWLWWLEDLLRFYKGNNEKTLVPEMIKFYETSSTNPLKIIGNFKNLRNNDLGHGYVKEDEWYEIITNDYEKSFDLLYKDLQFLSRYTLIYPEKTENLPDASEGYKYQVKSLMGSDMIPNKVDLSTTLRLIPNLVYVYSPSNGVLPLLPFISYKICPKCNIRKFYFLDVIQYKYITYNSFCNHRIEDKEAKIQFDQKYRFIFSNGNY